MPTRLVRAFRNSVSSISLNIGNGAVRRGHHRALIGRIGAVRITKKSEGVENQRDENK